MTISRIVLIAAMTLIGIGLVGILTRRHLIRIALAFTLASTGLNILLVWTGYLEGRNAPIINAELDGLAVDQIVDPLPQALVLTAIVIGVAVSALFIVVGVLTSRVLGTADVRELRKLKW